MKTLLTRTLPVLLLGCASACAQPVKVESTLVHPVNPPVTLSRDKISAESSGARAEVERLLALAAAKNELATALKNGLPEDAVKSLRDRISALEGSPATPSATPSATAQEVAALKNEIETLKADARRDRDLFLHDLADMKTSLENLKADARKDHDLLLQELAYTKTSLENLNADASKDRDLQQELASTKSSLENLKSEVANLKNRK